MISFQHFIKRHKLKYSAHLLARFPHCVVSGFLLVKSCALAACSPSTWKCVTLVDLLNGLLWAGRNFLPPSSVTLHLYCSCHLHPSNHFLSTWGAVMKIKKKEQLFLISNSDDNKNLPDETVNPDIMPSK